MGSHIINGEFQSDKYPTAPRGTVPLKLTDPMAQDLLQEYARRRRSVDHEFSDDLEKCLKDAGYSGPLTNNTFTREEFEMIKTLSREYMATAYSMSATVAEFEYYTDVYMPRAVNAAAKHVLALRGVVIK